MFNHIKFKLFKFCLNLKNKDINTILLLLKKKIYIYIYILITNYYYLFAIISKAVQSNEHDDINNKANNKQPYIFSCKFIITFANHRNDNKNGSNNKLTPDNRKHLSNKALPDDVVGKMLPPPLP